MIHRHGGHANKFIGDGLLAVFGAPERHADHAARAVAAAREIAELVRRGRPASCASGSASTRAASWSARSAAAAGATSPSSAIR